MYCYSNNFSCFQQLSFMRLSRKIKTETEPAVYIPPLNLQGNGVSNSPARPSRSKEHFNFFKATPLDQNADFLKEKSLYRYAISRKGPRSSVNKSHANLLGGRDNLNKTEENKGGLNKSMSGAIKQNSSICGTIQESSNKERHFRRKTRNQIWSSNVQLQNMEKSVENHLISQSQQSQMPHLQSLHLKLSESQSTSEMNLTQDLPSNLKQIKKQLLALREDNDYLRNLLEKKCSEFDLMEIKLGDLKLENSRLLQEIHRNCKIHSDSFINQSKMENQMRVKDTIILQLKDKLKYLELENIALKKYKSDKFKQEELIFKLEKKNRNLEEKVKILTRIKTKRHNLTGSMISQFSDMSLNLSADDDEPIKMLYPELKTAEKTPEKKRIPRDKDKLVSLRERLPQELLSPLWQPKMKA